MAQAATLLFALTGPAMKKPLKRTLKMVKVIATTNAMSTLGERVTEKCIHCSEMRLKRTEHAVDCGGTNVALVTVSVYWKVE